ncbi:LysR substrate-binding domain-containing protein [Phytohabitans sp. ZYX-F-186]|uniref:LysR substrate-binding domain-containing protein n=1 Tax=Phytohabitans maris TaxID=3071409 RepID=A0ABU0ZPP3_9ACTN|nr:LysR substrate-binding domain-containing protein [Phytohabitans sp. ZYX-F-186]MDQ7909004.1 LysR substrate-binding domain-containing protein [Phytohabitans sp. ZYX-F-186]
MLNANRLALLDELARSGTVHAVGGALSYSPSTVSQQLKVLEQEVGVALVERVGRGLVLTREGRALAEHARDILARMEEAESDLARLRGTAAGTIRVAVFQTAALSVLPTALDLLASSHPKLRVVVSHIDPARALPALAAREHDIVLGEEYPGRPVARRAGITLVPLFEDPLVLVVSPGTRHESVGELIFARAWVMEPEGNDARQWAVAACRDLGVEPRVQYESPDLLVQVRLVETGHAIAVVPELLLRRERPRVDRLEFPGRPSRSVFTAHRAAADSSPAVTAVTEAFAQSALSR